MRYGLVWAAALVLAACGGTAREVHSGRRPSHHQLAASSGRRGVPVSRGPVADLATGSAVPMVATPAEALARCLQSKLLGPICPRQVPLTIDPIRLLEDGCTNGAHLTLASSRCTQPGWSYQTLSRKLGDTQGARITAWDGTGWFEPTYAAMYPPPYATHVDIEASATSLPWSIAGPSFAGAKPAADLTDRLLNPSRGRAASLGRFDWYGLRGQLLLAPTGAGGGGEEAGHLIFFFKAHGVNYDVSLHGWASKERIQDHGTTRIINAAGAGPSLPNVIATLKAIIKSTASSS